MSNTGLGQGVGALFQKTEEMSQPEVPEKTRTTLRLYTRTLLLMDEMKLEAKRQGKKLTLGDIVDEAVNMYVSQLRTG